MSTASTPLPFGETFFLDSFANRQWVDVKHGTFLTIDKADFVQRVEEAYKGGAKLIDGYAPFCKYVPGMNRRILQFHSSLFLISATLSLPFP